MVTEEENKFYFKIINLNIGVTVKLEHSVALYKTYTASFIITTY